MEKYSAYNKVMTKLKEHNCSEAYVALKDLETDDKAAKKCEFTKDIKEPILASVMVWADTKQGYNFWENAAMDIGERHKPVYIDTTKA
jgi:hypothetical protein